MKTALILVVFLIGCQFDTKAIKERQQRIEKLFQCPNDAETFNKYFTECNNILWNGITTEGCLMYAHGLSKCEENEGGK